MGPSVKYISAEIPNMCYIFGNVEFQDIKYYIPIILKTKNDEFIRINDKVMSSSMPRSSPSPFPPIMCSCLLHFFQTSFVPGFPPIPIVPLVSVVPGESSFCLCVFILLCSSWCSLHRLVPGHLCAKAGAACGPVGWTTKTTQQQKEYSTWLVASPGIGKM